MKKQGGTAGNPNSRNLRENLGASNDTKTSNTALQKGSKDQIQNQEDEYEYYDEEEDDDQYQVDNFYGWDEDDDEEEDEEDVEEGVSLIADLEKIQAQAISG